MANQLPPLRLPLCVLSFIFLMSAMSNDKWKTGVSCSESLHSNVSDFEADNHLEMVVNALAAPAPAPAPAPTPPPPPPFTHYILALQWPPSLCKSRTCKRDFTVPKRFTIHGLWPSYDDGTYPENCNPNDKFDFGQILQIAKDLDTAWPSLFESKTQQAFLGHEWEKHGTCSGLTQYSYFYGALKTQEIVNVLNRLKAINFGPDPKKTYNPSDIITAYEKKYELVIKIVCVPKRGSTDEMIGEIHFRVNKVTKKVESITGGTTVCTKALVSFPDK